ncbi:MAG: hypothetical protein RQ757_06035 [Pseudomonadales bacterium]|nr:hypothetical protein [Pseudomonadales bacterium]
MDNNQNNKKTGRQIIYSLLLAGFVSACSSGAYQAQREEFNQTIPECNGTADCQVKWAAALDWVRNNASYGIRVNNENRIETFDADTTRAGTEVQVTRELIEGERYRILVNIDCFAAYGCPPYWETALDFNRTVNAAR